MHTTTTTSGKAAPPSGWDASIRFLPGMIDSDRERQGGAACFAGTRVPICTLFEMLADGDDVDEFLRGFPTVRREQALYAIELAAHGIEQRLGCMVPLVQECREKRIAALGR